MLIESTKGQISILTILIVAGAIITGIIFWTFMPPGSKSDIPNWITMTVELWVGIFIAISIFVLQKKTGRSLEAFNEDQKRLRKTLKLRSFELIEFYLSLARDFLEFDKGNITDVKADQQLNIVDNLLKRRHGRLSDTEPNIINKLKEESNFVRSREGKTDLIDNLKVIIDNMELLYGLTAINIPEDKRVQSWSNLCNNTLLKIKETNEIIQKIRSKENMNTPSA